MNRRFGGLALAFLGAAAGAESYREGLFGFDVADYDAARAAWTECAEAGDYRCQFGLGIVFNQGRGVEIDHASAARWFRDAARQGSTDAALELGILYAIGPDGIEQDVVAAYAWLVIAARDGDPVAEERRALLRGMLDDHEVAAAELQIPELLRDPR